jgi:RNA-directed DNA polymerase
MSKGSRSLLEQVSRKANLRRAWALLNKRPGSHGVDRVTIEDFASNLPGNLRSIEDRLRNGSYSFSLARPVAIRKASGTGKRPLRIPTIEDRVVQKAILLRLQKLPRFRRFQKNPRSFAYQRGRSMKGLVERVRLQMRTHAFVLESDITRFFDEANQERLISQLKPLLPDDSIIDLIRGALSAEIAERDVLPPQMQQLFPKAGQGLPQGAALSPLLSNVYLYPFDRQLTLKRREYVRYADDFVVFAKTYAEAEEAFYLCRDILHRLDLRIPNLNAPEKPSRISPTSGGFDFVGFRFEKRSVAPSGKAVQRLYRRIEQIMNPKEPFSLMERFLECERVLSGWYGSYGTVVDVSREVGAAIVKSAEAAHALLKNRGLARSGRLSKKQRKFLTIRPRGPRKRRLTEIRKPPSHATQPLREANNAITDSARPRSATQLPPGPGLGPATPARPTSSRAAPTCATSSSSSVTPPSPLSRSTHGSRSRTWRRRTEGTIRDGG